MFADFIYAEFERMDCGALRPVEVRASAQLRWQLSLFASVDTSKISTTTKNDLITNFYRRKKSESTLFSRK